MNNLTFVFLRNRKKVLESNLSYAQEFFYGATLFEDDKYNIKIIEQDEQQSNKLLNLFDRFNKRFFNIPSNSEKFLNKNNFQTMLNSDHIFFVNETVGYSLIFFLIYIKIFKKNINTSLFVMGLYSRSPNNKLFSFCHNVFLKILIFCIDNILILGKPEYIAAKKFHNNNTKLIYFPFGIDTNFWRPDPLVEKKYDVIFVGNDLNKDFDFVISLIKKMSHLKFLVVSSNEKFTKLTFNNLKVLNGQWGSEEITDEELRIYYLNSKVSILPIKETLQPSGQSVALQSMSLKLPLIISSYSGFWDSDKFIKDKHLYIAENSIDLWSEIIEEIIENKDSHIENIINKSKELIDSEFSLNIFKENLFKVIGI